MKKYKASVTVVGVDEEEDSAITELAFQLDELSRRLWMGEEPSEVKIEEIEDNEE